MTKTLADVVRAAEVLILDFDGPVAALFAGHPAAVIAGELRELATSRGYDLTALGPLAVLPEVASFGDDQLTRQVANAAREAEIRAAESATPTPGLDAVLAAARASGRRVAIASNNAIEAVEAYLRRRNLIGDVDLVVGRYDGMDPGLLKPHPHLVRLALDGLNAEPDTAVFIGDSSSDMEAGRAAHTATVGYANKPGKRERLQHAGADVVINHMADLADALRTIPILAR
ncbi:HAD-IA family hydrolase [Dactylosporangium sp. NPDC000555]|uniref:HAD family hydrolase n=1 Tax=Dactylosporangium sp. NPDC000555 TaxID=3154260 RepID=UPI00332FFA65